MPMHTRSHDPKPIRPPRPSLYDTNSESDDSGEFEHCDSETALQGGTSVVGPTSHASPADKRRRITILEDTSSDCSDKCDQASNEMDGDDDSVIHPTNLPHHNDGSLFFENEAKEERHPHCKNETTFSMVTPNNSVCEQVSRPE